jgi:hypothetical protein
MSGIRSGVEIVAGPNNDQVAALRPRDKATFAFKFASSGPAQSVEVTVVSVRHIGGQIYSILYVISQETWGMTYNAQRGTGVVRPR